MKPSDPGYKTRDRWFRNLYCRHYIDNDRSPGKRCPNRALPNADITNRICECRHQTGWGCSNDKNPDNIKLEDVVLQNL